MQRKNCWCLGLALAIFLLCVSFASGLRINEVMPNPIDTCSDCSEWIEIYSESPINLTDWIINTTNEQTNFSYYIEDFLIITQNKSQFLQNWPNVNETKIINWSDISLLNAGESIFLFDNSSVLVSNITYPSITENKTYALLSNLSWAICDTATPGMNNSCPVQNTTPPPQNPPANPPAANATIYLKIDYDEEIDNGDEFEVEVKAYRLLNKSYDVKIYITPEDDDTIISEMYNEDDEGWTSGTYYVDGVLKGPGNKTENFDVRIKSGNINFSGDAKIIVKLRQGSDIIAEIENDITILAAQSSNVITPIVNTTPTTNSQNTPPATTSVSRPGTVKLNSNGQQGIKTSQSKVLYKSKTQYFREYGIYGFAFICIIIIIMLLFKR